MTLLVSSLAASVLLTQLAPVDAVAAPDESELTGTAKPTAPTNADKAAIALSQEKSAPDATPTPIADVQPAGRVSH